MATRDGKADCYGTADHQNRTRTMLAVVTTGIGGYDKLEWRNVPIPCPGPEEALLQVLAAGINNTDINLRIGWYSKDVRADTAYATVNQSSTVKDGGWKGQTRFPIIQGTDCCGLVVSVGERVDKALVGQRSLVRPCIRIPGKRDTETVWMGSDFDGAFAQFVKVPASEVFPVACGWSDAELGTVPCAYGTAENMLRRAALERDEIVLVCGASGGVGAAAVQLAKIRGARVIAIADGAKHTAVSSLGAHMVLDRGKDPSSVLGECSVDVVVDNVAGPSFSDMLRTLKPRGRYVSSGAIAGPLVSLDMRTFYLKDLTLIGCTAWDARVFPSLISYIESGALRPVLAGTWPLDQIADAQRVFLDKRHVGKLVLVPPPVDQRTRAASGT